MVEDSASKIYNSPMIEKDHVEAAPADNQTDEMIYYADYSQKQSLACFFILIYLVIIVVAVFGNALVLLTWARQKKRKNSLDYLLCSLAVSDLLVGAFVGPAKLLELLAPADIRLFGDSLCTCLLFTQSLTIFSTIITLILIAAERYLVIVHPLRARQRKKRLLMPLLLVGSWLSAFILSAPNLLQAQHVDLHLYSQYGTQHRAGCKDRFDQLIDVNFRQAYFLFLFIMLYVMPILVIGLFNGRVFIVLFKRNASDIYLFNGSQHSHGDQAIKKQLANRKRVAIMMITVNIAFIVCWSPYFLTTLVTQYFYNFFQEGNFFFTMLCINACGFLNSAVNPIIYLMAPFFRRNYRDTLQCIFFCFGHSSADEASCDCLHKCHPNVCCVITEKGPLSSPTCRCNAFHPPSSLSPIRFSCRSTTSSIITSAAYHTTHSTGSIP